MRRTRPARNSTATLGSVPSASELRFISQDRHQALPQARSDAGGCPVSGFEVFPTRLGEPLLEVENLSTYFPIRAGVLQRTVGHVKAVDDVSFTLESGKTLGLVGESGSGKTTVGRTMLRLIPATSGSVRFKGQDVFSLGHHDLRKLRRHMQIIFQDPVSSLNPRMTVGNIIGEPLQVHGLAKGSEKADRVAELLKRVGLDPSYSARYPHEF